MRIKFTPVNIEYFNKERPAEKNDKLPVETQGGDFTLRFDHSHFQLYVDPYPLVSVGACFQVRGDQLLVSDPSLKVNDKSVRGKGAVEIKDGDIIGIPTWVSYVNYRVDLLAA